MTDWKFFSFWQGGCSPETMELIKNDILNVISKYVEIDKENCKIQIEKDKKPYLFANIPIKEVKVYIFT